MLEALGIIAGNRDFPLVVARSARHLGVRQLVAVGFPGITSKDLESSVDEMSWIGLGQLGRLKKFFQSRDIRQLVMVGQIPHRFTLSALRFDLDGLKFYKGIREKNARTLLGGLIQILEKEGFQFLDSTVFLADHLAPKGVFTRHHPTDQQWKDLEYGWKVAKVLADVEAGQTVIVKKGVLVALEGMEGTDAAILRGGELSGKGTVAVKVARTHQDMRYDVPVVGLETLKVLKRAKAEVLGLEAGRTLIIEPEKFKQLADQSGIAVVGLETGHEKS